jgi:hypothetical protein
LAEDWAAEGIPSKEWQNLASGHPQVLASKVEGSEAALADAVVASVEGSEVIEVVSVVVTEVASAEIEVDLAEEAALATRAGVASAAEEDSQTVLHHQMRPVDQADREAVDMVVGMEVVLLTALDLIMVIAGATGMAPAANATIVAAQAVRPGLTVVGTHAVA